LFGFRLELGRDRTGVRVQARRGGFVTERAALAEYRRLYRLRVREKPPKSHNGTRSLLLNSVTLQALTGFRPRPRAARVSGHMFAGRGGQPLRPDDVTSRFNQLAVAAGVRPIGPHKIRHLLASTLLDIGYGIPEVAERLGHDPATLMRYYSRVNAARRRQAADQIADLVASAESATHLDPAREPRVPA
jgi:integrase